jgi:pyruvyltransferase
MNSGNEVKAYWWNERPNFGDSMTPELLARLFGINASWASLEEADLTAAGSVIQWITPVRIDVQDPIHIWGSGYIFPEEPPPLPGTAIYHAVRGPQSAKLSGIEGEVVDGDPGLLASRVFDKKRLNRHSIGIVPHLWHRSDPALAEIAKQNDMLVIDVEADPKSVIMAIASCDFIFSSSLHGLVIADSFSIPNLWITLEPEPFGGRWKFNDYYGSFGLTIEPIHLTPQINIKTQIGRVIEAYVRPGIEAIGESLFKAFPFRP